MNSVKWDPQSSPTFWINHASRVIMRRFEERLRPLGFGMAYLPVAVALEEHGPMQQKDLLEHARIEQPTMASLLARMERDGLIVRKADPSDARARLVALTPRAKNALTRVKEAMRVVVEDATAGIGDKEQAVLMKTLQTIVKNLAD
jgi:MarR family transcriptional regulator, transcriptional regulator for hemolysin